MSIWKRIVVIGIPSVVGVATFLMVYAGSINEGHNTLHSTIVGLIMAATLALSALLMTALALSGDHGEGMSFLDAAEAEFEYHHPFPSHYCKDYEKTKFSKCSEQCSICSGGHGRTPNDDDPDDWDEQLRDLLAPRKPKRKPKAPAA